MASSSALGPGFSAEEELEARGAEQEAFEPPLLPAQLQVKGPLPATAEAVPAAHRPALGALATATPFALPQAPLSGIKEAEKVTEQLARIAPVV